MVTARSTPNIALIKYWGNRNDEMRLPMADSCSITLDRPGIEVTVEHAPSLTVDSYSMEGERKNLKEKDIARYAKHLELTKRFLALRGIAHALPHSVSITIRSEIPPAIGLASSAAVFSALAKAYSQLIAATSVGTHSLSDRDISIIARLGSGSAARSIFGGFVAFKNDCSNQESATNTLMDSAYAVQIAPEDHWPLHDVIIVPSMEEKKVGSTEGHAMAHTSPLYPARIEAIRSYRQSECIDAILKRDFEKLRTMTEEDCWDMHKVMQTQTPPLHYLNDETYRITKEIEVLRTEENLEVLYTMDAGPTVHLFCTPSALPRIRKYAEEQKGCRVYEANMGKGASITG